MANSKTKILMTALCSAVTLAIAQNAGATNLVTDGGFEANTGYGQLNANGNVPSGSSTTIANLTYWNSTGYNFLFNAANAATGVTSQYGSDDLALAGGMANAVTASPNGGNFVGMDSDYYSGAITQTINGLTVGKNYTLSFYWGAAQQTGFYGNTYDNITASLGAQSFTTSTYYLPAQTGFSGWMEQTYSYTATGTSEVLSFLAAGSPQGPPPFALLDGVTLSAPDATSTAILVGFAASAMGLVARSLRRK